MKKVILCALVLAVSGVLHSSVLAQEVPKSVHMRLVHSRGDLCLLLCSDLLDRRGNGGRIIEL
jgi:hypothetical protein